tara:strand:- start:1421 stop:1927 length:507 start_codon:yes stop_codon:yes gene_type:complete
MGKGTAIKYGWAYLSTNKSILDSLKLIREFAKRQGKKTQTATDRTNRIYAGRNDKVGSTIMSHGRLRALTHIKEMQKRRGLQGRKLRLSDFHRNVKVVPSKETMLRRLTKAKQKHALKTTPLYDGVRNITKRTSLEKMGAAENRLRKILGGDSKFNTYSFYKTRNKYN